MCACVSVWVRKGGAEKGGYGESTSTPFLSKKEGWGMDGVVGWVGAGGQEKGKKGGRGLCSIKPSRITFSAFRCVPAKQLL